MPDARAALRWAALRRERNHAYKPERYDSMTSEEHATFLQRNRDQYRGRMDARCSLAISGSLETQVDQIVWQRHTNPPPLTDQQIGHVVDVLHAHAVDEVSRSLGSAMHFSLSVPLGSYIWTLALLLLGFDSILLTMI